MTRKLKAQTPTLQDALNWLEGVQPGHWRAELLVKPEPGTGKVYATLEVFCIGSKGQRLVGYRTGELVSSRSPDQMHAAWYRAAVRYHLWAENQGSELEARLYWEICRYTA